MVCVRALTMAEAPEILEIGRKHSIHVVSENFD